MNKKITITTGHLEKAGEEFIEAWHRAEANIKPQPSIEKITFQDQRLLFKTLTPKRFALLKHIHEQDGVSMRSVAKALDRDYSNVHNDVKILHQLGLITKDETSHLCYVPWDVIVTEIALPMRKTQRVRQAVNSSPLKKRRSAK
jgi:predicted transcriptional regulator